jgi:hypothetical protein
MIPRNSSCGGPARGSGSDKDIDVSEESVAYDLVVSEVGEEVREEGHQPIQSLALQLCLSNNDGGAGLLSGQVGIPSRL